MKKLSDIIPKGLTGRLIRFITIFVFAMGAGFLLISQIELNKLKNLVHAEEQEQADLVHEKSMESVSNLVRDSLLNNVIWEADKVDDEFFILDHDIRVLHKQVEDILRDPEKYETLSVEPPKKENQGVFSLQLLAPGDYEDISAETMETMGKLANLAPMMEEMVRGNEGFTLDCYIALPDGTCIGMDALAGGKFDENGNIESYDASSRPWFQEAVKKGDVAILLAHSFFYDTNEAIYGMPVYVDGELAAVLQMSTRLEVIQRKMTERTIGESGFSILVNPEGQMACSSGKEGELQNRKDITEDIREYVNPDLAGVIQNAMSEEYGVTVTEVDGEPYYAAYSTLETIGWTQIAFASSEELHAPAALLVQELNKSTDHMLTTMEKGFARSAVILIIIIAAIAQTAIILASQFAKIRVEPLNRMSQKVKEFNGEDRLFEMEDVYKTGDEIQVLAESFEDMSLKMKQYIREIVNMSTERERIDAEMRMASQIQESMLPRTFPAFPNRKDFDLYANMKPAKNVGGDFYDFFLLDEDHLALVMADVSGKGITAALFMALSKQVIQSRLLLSNGDVTTAITEANLQLIEESLTDMFVTVWLGVVTLSTGELRFVDAGHEYPAVRRRGGAFVIVEDDHSMPVAALDIARYHVNEMVLKPGDVLFLYTDGVPEAHNPSNEMFEMDRLVATLNEKKDATLQEMDDYLRMKVAEFSQNAEQWDDITTLWFRYLGP